MYLAYLDESGDTGLVNSPTAYFVLSCVLVHESNWLESLNCKKEQPKKDGKPVMPPGRLRYSASIASAKVRNGP